MHRIVAARNLYQSSLHGISLSSNNSANISPVLDIKCSFCRRILIGQPIKENLLTVRHQSTRTVSLLRSQKKKSKHKSYKKYGELLEVGEKVMTETKVSISKLHAAHLSKLASSPVSLGQLHQLTAKPAKKIDNVPVDPELLQSVREQLLKKTSTDKKTKPVDNDQCALVYTTHKISNMEQRLNTKAYLDMVKESYYNFQKATLYDQRLQDLRYAINEGVTQEFDLENSAEHGALDGDDALPKSPHAVFKALFVEKQLDSYDHELMNHLSNLHSRGIAHPAIEDIYDEGVLGGEICDIKEDLEPDHHAESIEAKGLMVKKANQALKKKKKEKREKRRAIQESNMKQDIKQLQRHGKQEALHKLLCAHLQLLCSLNMVLEARQVLQHYRQKTSRGAEPPKVTDIKVYNALLHGYASLGMLDSTKELVTIMLGDGVELNAQSFAAVIECVERSLEMNKNTVFQYYHTLMQDKGISLNDVMDKAKFLYDQRQVVLNGIRRIQPDFEPQYTPPELDYVCPLLDKLKLDQLENRRGLLNSPAAGLLTLEEMVQKGREQLELEIKGEIQVENINVKNESSPMVQFCRKKLQETEEEWRVVIREAFVRNVSTLRSQSSASHSAITLYPYLKVLEVDQFVQLIMSEINKLVDGSESYSPTLKLMQRDLGTQVYQKYVIEQYRRNGVLEKMTRMYEKYCAWYLQRRLDQQDDNAILNSRQAWATLLHAHPDGPSLDFEETPWPLELRQNIGKFLYNIIINDVKIDVNMFKTKGKEKKLPAVYKVHRPWGRAVRLELKPHPVVWRVCAGAARRKLTIRAPLAPTRAPPAPWTSATNGAYLLSPPPLIRMPFYVRAQWARLHEAPPANLYPVLDSLNQLADVPWTINKPLLDLQMKIFRSGGNKKLDIPPPASSLDTSQFDGGSVSAGVSGDVSAGVSDGVSAVVSAGVTGGVSASVSGGVSASVSGGAARSAALKRRLAISRARADMHSLWCDALYKLSLANHFRDSVFWLPHNMDFRGRVYACPPHVSVLGADTQRALLVFAQKYPLGPHGLRWLQLHAVNLTGALKKKTIQQRLEYAESIMDKILDSADRPLDGEGWWMDSEEPWQTLACCMEIANAVRSPNHEEYLCGFPVQQDGSCNGLQHYAALGGDAAGAAAVNLAPRGQPQDVYSSVAALVEEMRARDAAAGVPAAVMLENFVRRKVIKQTVMTTVYGVTKFGARLQIAKQLKDIEEFPKEHVWACSQYLTAKTFDSLREMFTSTKLIQDWFTECAKVISGVCGESVEWVTPLGLPVVQPYYRRAPPQPAHVRAPLDLHQRPCTMKQRNAFPPNFIHSLDSSHMMLTGLHCAGAGLSFVSVHDCFWTHPHTAHTMNQICREQFVALHSQPILEDLSNFLVQKYSYAENELEDGTSGASNKKRVNSLLQKVPSKGDFDINSVLRSVYFFS